MKLVVAAAFFHAQSRSLASLFTFLAYLLSAEIHQTHVAFMKADSDREKMPLQELKVSVNYPLDTSSWAAKRDIY